MSEKTYKIYDKISWVMISIMILSFLIALICGPVVNRTVEKVKVEMEKEVRPIIIKPKVNKPLKIKWSTEGTAVNMITQYEGFRSKAYWDVKRWSVGYGQPANSKWVTISKEDALKFVKERVSYINKRLKINGFNLSPLKQAILIDFAFQYGITKFVKSTFAKKIKAGDFKSAKFQLARWVYIGDKVSSGIQKRRKMSIRLWTM